MFEEGQRHNSPAPDLDPKYQRKLTDLGGLNPFGEPNLKIIWGGTAKKWFRGKLRTKYVAPTIRVQERQTFTRYKGKKVQKYATLDMALDGEENFPGSLFRLQTDYEWIGKHRWYVEQWHPAEQYAATPEAHEALRWRPVFNDKELGNIARCDMLGPYPVRGFYDMCVEVAEFRGEHNRDGSPVLYYRPFDDDVIQDVMRRIHEREKAPVKGNVEQILKDDLVAKEAAEDKAFELDVEEKQDVARIAYNAVTQDRAYVPAMPKE